MTGIQAARRLRRGATAAACGIVLAGVPAAARGVDIVQRKVVPDMAQYAAVTDVTRHGDSVTGTIVNRTPNELRDVKLLVTEHFFWADEFHPGSDNPSRAHVVTLPQSIPPDYGLVFLTQVDPLPKRDDGRFKTGVEVIGATSVSPAR